MLLWVHPVVQTLAIGLSLHVLHLGWARFRTAHLGAKGAAFAWQDHVRQGAAVLSAWIMGFIAGLGVTWWSWGETFTTGSHHVVALAMLPLMLFGLGSGFYMDRMKARRRALPLAHGCVNALLVLLALWQLVSGVLILRGRVLG